MRANPAQRLRSQAETYSGFATIFGFLLVLGAGLVGYTSAETEVCSAFSCESEIDEQTFALTAVAYLAAGLVLLVPISGIAHLMRGLADIIEPPAEVEAATVVDSAGRDEDAEPGPGPDHF